MPVIGKLTAFSYNNSQQEQTTQLNIGRDPQVIRERTCRTSHEECLAVDWAALLLMRPFLEGAQSKIPTDYDGLAVF